VKKSDGATTTDASGAVKMCCDYTPFGEQIAEYARGGHPHAGVRRQRTGCEGFGDGYAIPKLSRKIPRCGRRPAGRRGFPATI
jgi:hypothetical protein